MNLKDTIPIKSTANQVLCRQDTAVLLPISHNVEFSGSVL